MKEFWTLTRVQLRGILASLAQGKNKARPRSAIFVIVLFAFLAVLMSTSYSFSFVAALAPTNSADLVLVLMPVFGAFFTVALGSQAAGAFVFSGKDNELLLSLPISRIALACAKFAAVLIENLFLMICLLVPAGVAYALQAPVGPWFWPVLGLDAVLLALGTTALSIVLGLAMTAVKNLPRGTLITNIFGMGLLLAIVAGSMLGQAPLNTMLRHDPAPIRAWLTTWLPPFVWARDAAVDGSASAVALLALVSVVPFVGVAWLVGRSFVAIVSGASVKRGSVRHVSLDTLRSRTPLVALIVREARRFFGTSIYFLNAGFGIVILIALAIGLLIAGRLPAELALAASVVKVPLGVLLALAVALIASTVDTTAPSISLEGKRLWILKESPVKAETVLAAKVAFNVLVVLPGIVLAALAIGVVARPSLPDGLLALVLPTAVSVAVAELGLLANLVWPNLDAPNDTVAVKQGISVVAALLGGMALVALAAVAGMALAPIVGGTTAFWLATLVVSAVAAAEAAALRTWGVRQFDALG